MKKIFFSLSLSIAVLLVISACGGSDPDPEPAKTPEELAILDLTGGATQVWAIAGGGTVTRDGRLETSLYANFELSLASTSSSKTYQTSNSNNLFDGNGNWTFESTNFDRIRLSGSRPASDRDITFTRTGDRLELRFNIPMPSGRVDQRIEAIAGSYVFTLVKK